MPTSNSKQVVKNAAALTLRMVLVTIVGLFTSRIVLKALGVEDYGIYGVIGGVVGMASFLNTSMAGATSRFITFELGHGDEDKLKKIFSTSLIIHLVIALLVAILAETVGLWFVNNKMNFPVSSMPAVNVLYQFTILSMIVNFTQVPYSAAIIAHERMNIYAYFEIINVVLKLAIVYILLVIDNNRLVYYAAMMFAVSVISAMTYRIYCIKHFNEAKFRFVLDRQILKSMLTFSGFDLYGNMCATANNSGILFIQNIIFGVIANAGASIAASVSGAISGLTMSIAQAFKPQIVKKYSVGDIKNMTNLMRRSVQFTMLAYAIIALPILIEAETVLSLWLGQVPQYSVEFLRLIIIVAFFSIVINANHTAIHATGNIKNISFISGTMFLLSPVVSYLVLRFGIKDANIVYITNILFYFIISLLGWQFLKIQIPTIILRDYIKPIIKSWGVIAAIYVVSFYIVEKIKQLVSFDGFTLNLLFILIIGLLGCILLVSMTMLFAMKRDECNALISFACRRFRYLYIRRNRINLPVK